MLLVPLKDFEQVFAVLQEDSRSMGQALLFKGGLAECAVGCDAFGLGLFGQTLVDASIS
jgi:hypothetical protein